MPTRPFSYGTFRSKDGERRKAGGFRLPPCAARPPRWLAWLLVLAALVAAFPATGSAQTGYGFRFVRVKYGGDDGDLRGFGRVPTWAHDYPTAEHNFYEALERTTGIHVEGPPLILTLDDDRIFEYPVLYLCEPGYWSITDEEAQNLREYLLRGGFLLFDDFRGPREWNNLVEQMRRVFPDREPQEIPPDHAVWSIYYDIDPVEAPSNVSGGFRGGFSKYDDQYFALFDDEGRMMALMCYNQDIGDGWEWPDQNFEQASTISFQMGINFLMYALTH